MPCLRLPIFWKNSNGEYAILGIPYAQYLKGEFDFAKKYQESTIVTLLRFMPV